jgi:hypothetical protein
MTTDTVRLSAGCMAWQAGERKVKQENVLGVETAAQTRGYIIIHCKNLLLLTSEDEFLSVFTYEFMLVYIYFTYFCYVYVNDPVSTSIQGHKFQRMHTLSDLVLDICKICPFNFKSCKNISRAKIT